MSKKQLGAASDSEPVSDGGGWFSRLRAQPGFRSAAIAFVLTVVLGLGGSAAYAYWSLRVDANLIVATARPDLPSVAAPICNDRSFYTRVSWTAPAGMPSDAVYVLRISTSRDTVDYAFPAQTTYFEPASLRVNGESLNSWMGLRTGSVTVSTGFLAPGASAPGVVDAGTQILSPSKASPTTSLRSNSSLISWFTC